MMRLRPFRRIIRRLLFVIALMLVVAAGCTVWAGNCAKPQDLELSTEFATQMQQKLDEPGQAAWLFFTEVSRQLSWHGTSRIHDFNLTEICQADDCAVEEISIDVEVEHRPICSWVDNHFKHSLAAVTINDFTTMESEFEIEAIRASWGSYEPSSSFPARVDWVRNLARRQIAGSIWTGNSKVKIAYNRYFGNWFPDSDWYVVANTTDQTTGTSFFLPHPEPAQALRIRSN